MENRLSYTLVGGFFIACMVAMALFVWWIGRYGEDREAYRPYYLLTKELQSGIKKQTPVRFQGIPVGFVRGFDFSKEHSGWIEIELWVEQEIPIKRDSLAVIESQGLSGISYIAIKQGSEDSPLFGRDEKAILNLGETLVEKIGGRADMISQDLSVTLSRINALLEEKNLQKIASILESTDRVMLHLAQGTQKLESAMEAGALMMNATQKTLEGVDETLRIAQEELRGVGELRSAIQRRIEGGEYDLRSALVPWMVQSEELMLELHSTLKESRGVMQEWRASPYRFLFSETISPKGPGE